MQYIYPVYQPNLSGKEKQYVLDCLESTWISSKGKYISTFEDLFAKYINVKHAAAVSNGTVAIHVALLALGVGPGDEVIVPSFTYIASVNAIAYTGAKPVFVDSLMDTWQMDVEQVRQKITKKTKAIMCVHLYGQSCDMDALIKIAQENNIYLIEDCAEAIGTQYKDKYVGTFGDISTFSFFGNKTITTGEGGMVVTNNISLHEKTVHLKGQGLAKNMEYWHDIIGYNYRMTNICAAIGVAQLERIENILAKKKKVAQMYMDKLKGLPISFQKEQENTCHSYWMFSILVNEAEKRDGLRKHLSNAGIETRPLFHPVHTMPMYNSGGLHFPVAELLGKQGINLPSYPDLTEDDIEFITDKITCFFK